MILKGRYFNGKVSKEFAAELAISGTDVMVLLSSDVDEQLPNPALITDMLISSRIDTVSRSLRFPDGQLFQCDAVDTLVKAHGLDLTSTFAH